MKDILKQKNYMLAAGLFAILCVVRFWDRTMADHSVTVHIFKSYSVMELVTALYFAGMILFCGWVLQKGSEKNHRFYEYFLTMLLVVAFPAFLSENYFGCLDPLGILIFLCLFVVGTKIKMPSIFLAVLFNLMSVLFLKDRCQELTTVKFVVVAIFFLVVVLIIWQKVSHKYTTWAGLPVFIIWTVLGDYNRGLFYLITGAIFMVLYNSITKNDETEDVKEISPVVAISALVCVALFVIFWMYGEPLLLEETILEY